MTVGGVFKGALVAGGLCVAFYPVATYLTGAGALAGASQVANGGLTIAHGAGTGIVDLANLGIDALTND